MRILLLVFTAALTLCCNKKSEMPQIETKYSDREDYHSYSNPKEARVRHVALDLNVDFVQKTLQGTSTLTLDRAQLGAPGKLMLDTRELDIARVEISSDATSFSAAQHQLGQTDKILGTPLTVQLPAAVMAVRIHYSTAPSASGLQWLTPAQTAGKKHPFLFTQSQAIHARSWIPLQDSPGVRVTYSARVRTPKELLAVMSADNTQKRPVRGEYTFEMPQPIPPYLIALAVGDLEFRSMSGRTGVYAEPSVVEKAAREFEDTEKMMEAAERLYGPYRWGRYDILVLPPSFPFGGMENPRLTFATPTILAGDKSLVSLVAHELAHSWSGNLVTNATWRDFWLNEGFTVYLENRIQEEVYGPARAEMEALLEKQELEREMATLEPSDEVLYVDLKGRDPDEGFTQVPYVKGMLFLRRLEELFGRERFDRFLTGYFANFGFRSITTGDFVQYLRTNLLDAAPSAASQISLDAWLTEPGLPPGTPQPKSDALSKVEQSGKEWLAGKRAVESLPGRSWTTQEWLHFLTSLPQDLDTSRMSDLDRTFHLTASGNSEIVFQWLLMSIRSDYRPGKAKLSEFLSTVGRRKYIRRLYQELAKTPAGKQTAIAIYKNARAGYHPIAAASIDEVLR